MMIEILLKHKVLVLLVCFLICILYFLILRYLSSNQIKLTNFRKVKRQMKQYDKYYNYLEETDIKNKTFIGTSSGNKKVYTNDNAKHIFISGTTGSGKTVALANYIKSAVDKDYGLLIIDGKGDTTDGSILDIVNRLKGNKKLYVINMTDPENSDSYNPFKDTNYTICKDMLVNMTDWSEEHYKANTERYLQRVVKLMSLADIEYSFEKIINYVEKDNFAKLSADLSKREIITKEEHAGNLKLVKESGDIANSALARFSTIYESVIGNIFKSDGIDITQALKEKAIILFILNPLSYPELSPLMGRLVLIDCKKAVSNLFKANNKQRAFFVFDEINVYISSALINLLNKSRSANITCIPATQSLSDLEEAGGEALKNQVLENCNNYIILRQNTAKSSEEWAKTIGTKQSIELTYQIEQDSYTAVSTGLGSARKVREFIYHPDDIKQLRTGEAFYISKDERKYVKLHINKPF